MTPLNLNDPIDVHVRRDDLARIDIRPAAPAPPLQDGQVLLAVDQFALSANNITYATCDDSAGFWKVFPAEPPWGRIPVWGFAEVARSRHPLFEVGERVFGFLPMSTYLVIEPARVTQRGFTDASSARAATFATYNQYGRIGLDPAREDLHAVLRPLFFTSFVLDDHLADNGFFGARTVLLSSASSKTTLGAAFLLRQRGDVAVCGLTSARHCGFVRATGCFDSVLAYDDVPALDPSVPTAYVDFSGNNALRHAVHTQLGAGLVHSLTVGATHWTALAAHAAPPPGVAVQSFFGPAHIRKRRDEWGAHALHARHDAAAQRFETAAASQWLTIDRRHGPAQLEQAYHSVLRGQADPARALVLRLHRDDDDGAVPAEERAAMSLMGFQKNSED